MKPLAFIREYKYLLAFAQREWINKRKGVL